MERTLQRENNKPKVASEDKPQIPNQDHDPIDLENVHLNQFPVEEKPKDLQNKIVQLKVTIENEENSKEKKQKIHTHKK